MSLIAKIDVRAHGDGLPRQVALLPIVRDPDQAAGFAERERANQQCVHHAENGRACADPESHDENREGSETGVTAQRAERVPQILQQGVEERDASHRSMLLADLREST